MPPKGNVLRTKEWKYVYRKWDGMMARCYSAKNKHYKKRNIDVFRDWHNFPTFFDYIMDNLGMPPEDGIKYTLDRINNDAGYYPDNLRWADYRTQERNRSNNVFIEYNGERRLLVDFAQEHGMKATFLYDRIFRRGWTVAEALLTKKLTKSEYLKPRVLKHEISVEIDGVTKRLSEISKEYNILHVLLYSRIKKGWNIWDAINTPSNKGNSSKRKSKKWLYKNELLTLNELAEKYNIKRATLEYRLKIGWPIEAAIETNVSFNNKKLNLQGSHKKDDTISNMAKPWVNPDN